MEIRSIASSGDAVSTPVQDMDKGQNMDAFTELFAMLFNNMLIPGSNQTNFAMSQNNLTASTDTIGDNVLSALDTLRFSGSQLGNTDGIQNFVNSNGFSLLNSVLGSNPDFQKLLTGNIPAELQEFIRNINSVNSNEADNGNINLTNNTINIEDILSGQLDKSTINSEAKAILGALNLQTEGKQPSAESKKIADLFNSQLTAIETVQSSVDEVVIPVNSTDNISKETNEYSANNSSKSEIETKSIIPEKKTINPLESTKNFEQTLGLNSIRSENINSANQQMKVQEPVLVEKPQDIIDMTVRNFKTLRLPGSTEVTVKLRPEELGEVSLKLVLEKGQINGNITAERKEVVSMLQNSLDQLKADLKNNNVNLSNITVNMQAGENFDSNNSRRSFNSKQNKSSSKIEQVFEEEIISNDLMEGFNIIA